MIMIKVNPVHTLAPLLLLLLVSCGESSQQGSGASQSSSAQPQALVLVDSSPITVDEFESAKSRFDVGGALLDANFDDTLLKSLISSRAMSQLAAKEMDAESVRAIELKAAAYREELLVKEYLKRHASPVPVSESMVREYYDKHPEEFSGGMKKEFEYFISSVEELKEGDRKRILDFIGAARDSDGWNKLLEGKQDLPVNYRKVKARLSVLEEPLKTLVASTSAGNTSSVHMGKQIVIVRVLGEEPIPARPLTEVSADIRKRLAPMQLRKAVKEVSELALQQVKVTYPNKDN